MKKIKRENKEKEAWKSVERLEIREGRRRKRKHK